MKNVSFYVSGTHCASCKLLIEDVLGEHAGIHNPSVDLQAETVSFDTDLTLSNEELVKVLSAQVEQHGYTFSTEKIAKTPRSTGVIWQALPIGLAILSLFFVSQKSGILNFGINGTATPITGFIIGLVASVSSCLAVVGGLVLSLSATESQAQKHAVRPMVLFHTGRIVSFALLGGALGALGSALGINFTITALLGILASLVMVALGLNLVGVFEKNILTLPTGIFSMFRTVQNTSATPLVLGAGTFFLPCGFTQAMQVAALSSGTFFSGLLLMTAFALGTFPMLALLSFGSASFARSKHAPLFFASAGVVVIGLGVFALLTGLAGLGVIDPLFTV